MNKESSFLDQPPKKIIVRMPNWLGDLVMATPVLEDLRKKWPDAEITAMCQSNVAGLLKDDPNIDSIFSFEKPKRWIHRVHQKDIIDPLRMGKYDLGILLTNSFSSAWWFWRGHVKNRLGYQANARNLLLTKAVPFPKNLEKQHLVITYKELLTPLDIPVSNTSPHLYVSKEEQDNARELLSHLGITSQNTVIGINPGAAFGTAKCWLPERFRKVTEELLQDPSVYVLYFGDRVGAPLVTQICADMPERVINLAGKTNLRQLIALIQECNVFLTNDSGPMHIAAALGTPLVALFGSTSDIKTGPYNLKGKVIHKRVECSPCYKRVCPIDFRCMKRIEADEVTKAIQEVLKS